MGVISSGSTSAASCHATTSTADRRLIRPAYCVTDQEEGPQLTLLCCCQLVKLCVCKLYCDYWITLYCDLQVVLFCMSNVIEKLVAVFFDFFDCVLRQSCYIVILFLFIPPDRPRFLLTLYMFTPGPLLHTIHGRTILTTFCHISLSLSRTQRQ